MNNKMSNEKKTTTGGHTKSMKHSAKVEQFKLATQQPSFVKFGATWCRPCVKFAPIYDSVAKENPKLKFLHVDVDDDTDIVEYVHTLSSSQGGKIIIRSVPAILMFYKGKHITTLSESTESAMVEAAKDHLSFALKVKK